MYPLVNYKSLEPLLTDIGDRPVVMLGEASHGTHEYYTWRTAISKKLITEKKFNFIAVEGDWPDCYLINRFVKGYTDAGTDIVALLKKFDRWPTWMWANWEIVALADGCGNTIGLCHRNGKLAFMAWMCTVCGILCEP